MSVNQTLLDFRVTPESSGNWMKIVQDKISEVMKESFQADKAELLNGTFMLFSGKHGVQCTVQLYPDGFVTIDVKQYIKGVSEENALQKKDYLHLQNKVKQALSCVKADFIPTICRGRDVLCYHDTTDLLLKEYDFDREVFRQQSDYQDVWIVHSPRYGNMLYLDMEEMLSEKDLVYTKSLLGNGRECYKDKEILILGGGDGGVLHELLKEEPRFVTMVEIDKVVVEASAKHLRGICGSCLDSYTGENYEIIIDNCVTALKEYINRGKAFDYVINDLTDIPVEVSLEDSQWDFVHEISDLAIRVLKHGGKFYAQGSYGAACKEQREQYEKQLMNLSYPVEFKREFVDVPSFEETWTFYEVWRK